MLTIGGPAKQTELTELFGENPKQLKVTCWVSGRQDSSESQIQSIISQVKEIVDKHCKEQKQAQEDEVALKEKAKEKQMKPKVIIKSKYDEEDEVPSQKPQGAGKE